MMADRLKSVDLELDLNEETKEEHAPVKVEITGEPAHPETFDYKRTITNFIEMERLKLITYCLLYTSPSPRDQRGSRMPSSA